MIFSFFSISTFLDIAAEIGPLLYFDAREDIRWSTSDTGFKYLRDWSKFRQCTNALEKVISKSLFSPTTDCFDTETVLLRHLRCQRKFAFASIVLEIDMQSCKT